MSEEWWRTEPTRPIKVANGIRTRTQHGDIARTWWSRRFLDVLESLGMGGRLERGRRYARAGQVLSLSLSTSIVVATVQGSRPTPYRVRIAIKAFTPDEWVKVEKALARQALFMAKLLAGEMPVDIESAFEAIGLKLFPDSANELSMECSCPDWEVPCKHLAAACYLLAESFDADPFAILAWRGRGRQELLDHLRSLRDGSSTVVEVDTAEPLSAALASFWDRPAARTGSYSGSSDRPDALLDQLDALPVIVRGRPLVEFLRVAYRRMGQ